MFGRALGWLPVAAARDAGIAASAPTAVRRTSRLFQPSRVRAHVVVMVLPPFQPACAGPFPAGPEPGSYFARSGRTNRYAPEPTVNVAVSPTIRASRTPSTCRAGTRVVRPSWI